jgi:hypothetical protein
MANQLHLDYTFTPGGVGVGTVRLNNLNIQLRQLKMITNVTTGVIVFQFNNPAKLATRSFSNPNTTFTLTFNTTGQNAADELAIIYDDGLLITAVTATNLDVRDLTSASDSVAVHGDVGVLDQLDLTNSNPAVVAIVDGTGNQITSFGGSAGSTIFSSNLTLDTGGSYTTGDSFCSLLPVTNAVLLAGQTSTLTSISLTDKDNIGQGLVLYFFDRSVTLPANNAVWNVSDADMDFLLPGGMIQINTGDWIAPGTSPINRSVALDGYKIKLRPNSGTSIFMAAYVISAVAGTHTSNGVSIRLGIEY